jgi:TP53 regulating kinase and related kinases
MPFSQSWKFTCVPHAKLRTTNPKDTLTSIVARSACGYFSIDICNVQVLRNKATGKDELVDMMKAIGGAVAKLHDGNLVHGDLTTSNMIMREPDNKLVIIDFGLAYNSSNPEDKAVDLYVMERAFVSAHSDRAGLFKMALEAYMDTSKHHTTVLGRFAEVRMRGRKRTMVG